MLPENNFDIVVIGGGINGVGIARDAAGRGFKVLLCEKGDLASGTSSASTKLIHGGLRYLEHKQFRLVRESLKEREILMHSAPHIISSMRFVLPHIEQLRPYWTIRAGLFLYDFMAGRRVLKRSKAVNLKKHEVGKPLEPLTKQGFIYSDCAVQDARLVILNAMDAKQLGAEILTRTACMTARKKDDQWEVVLRDVDSGKMRNITADILINAAGPWINIVQHHVVAMKKYKKVRLVKGSHIIVPKIFEHDHAYILQQDDRRVVFAIPFEQKFTLIGTTEEDYKGDPANAEISDQEIKYLCKAANNYFKHKIVLDDIVWTYSGVRPLIDSGENVSEISRDYFIETDNVMPRLLTIYGGKVTTYRKLAESVMEALGVTKKKWTHNAILPGGKIGNFNQFLKNLRKTYPWLSPELSYRYARTYGALAEKILAQAQSAKDLGHHLGDEVYEAELDYLCRFEWAKTAEDVLYRRTKLNLHVSVETKNNIKLWLERNNEQ